MITFVPLSQANESQNRLWQLLMILETAGQITVMQWLCESRGVSGGIDREISETP